MMGRKCRPLPTAERAFGVMNAEYARFVPLSENAYDRDLERSEAIVTFRRSRLRSKTWRFQDRFRAKIIVEQSLSQAVQAESIGMRSRAIGRDPVGWYKMRSHRPVSLKRD